ncbi:hypothetical protein ACKWTF_003609 [Chironomus riparius]
MEPDQQSTAERDNETTQQTETEQIKCEEKCDKIEKPEEIKINENSQSRETKPQEQNSIKKDDSNVVVPQSIQLNSTDNKSELETKTNETNSENNEASNSKNDVDKTNENSAELSDEKKSVEIENKNNNDSKTNSNYMSAFPGIKTGNPGGSDDKIEIDRESLFDRVILYSLKNTVVDNSRLDAAKNKYIKNNGNVNASFNNNNNNNNNNSNINNNSNNSSNGSDSNSTSKSVEKLIEEFKGSCKSNNGNTPSTTTSKIINEQHKIDNKEILNGADKSIDSLEPANKNVENEKLVEDVKVSPKPSDDVVNSSSVHDVIDLKTNSPNMAVSQQQMNTENEGLDFRDSSSSNTKNNEDKAGPTMLDLSVKRDDKSVPPIKRSHALYVGIPDFSKQIFTAPSITRPTNTQMNPLPSSSSNNAGVAPKVRNPDFSSMSRAPELQMRNPDFSKGFGSLENPPPSNIPITPSNFPEIARKNNYISDLQLKPPPSASMTPSTSYKIDYRLPSMPPQKVLNEQQQNIDSNAHSKSPYPSSKGENESIYNQQLVDEPMAHIIHKNQFLPTTKESINSNWNENRERLLGGSSHYEMMQLNEKKMPGTSQPFPSNDDLRKLHPAHYPYAYKDRELQHQSNEFSLKQKEQLLRQEGTTITIKNESNAKTPTQEFPERRSADLFRDYKLKQPKESPDTARRVNEPPPLAYQQQYPDFPPNYLRSPKPENMNIKMNPTSPVPQSSHSSLEYPPLMPHYKTPSPIPHRQQKSPSMHGNSPMNPPQNWPPMPSQSSRHSMSPANMSLSPSHLYPHAGTSKPTISQSQSPITHYPYHTSPKLNHQMFKHPEATSSRPIDPKRPPMQSHSPVQNYYHQNYPDFGRKFGAERNNAMFMQEQGLRIPSSYSPIDTKPLTIDLPQPSIPLRQDLEIRSVREPSDNRHSQYRHPSSSNYVMSQERELSRLPPTQQLPLSENISIRMPEIRSQYPRLENEASIILPDLKIEKRISEPSKIYSPIPTRRQESIPELSIIPKIKTEPPSSTPTPSNSSIIKSSNTIFTAVKRESPLDLSVKTIKTKADSTGCDPDFRYKKESKLGLKVEFTPNFGNIAKTDCRQQARLGPQDYNLERSAHEIPVRYVKDQDIERNSIASKILEPQVATNSRNHFYDYKQQQPTSDADRPHAPVPMLPNYYPDRHKPNNVYEGNNNITSNAQLPENVRRSYENSRQENNYPPKTFQPIPQRTNYHSSQSMAQNNVPYPVINKTSPAMTSQPSNSKDPRYLEKERDRKYVENILYGRNRKELDQKPYQQDSRQFQPITSPPRKRHNEMSNQHMCDPTAPKQSRVEELPRLYSSNMPPHAYERRESNMNACPPTHVRHETYPKVVSASTDTAYKHYPIPRKDVIKSAEIMAYNNQGPAANYYPNPKAEMIHRNDPSRSQKYYSREPDRNFYHHQQQPPPKQNFLQRPDDASYPVHIPRISHPVQDMSIKVEQLTPGPIPENQGEPQKLLNNILMPSSVSGSNGNIARGAEQSTIQKLKSNLELKEMQKLKKNELCEEIEHIKLLNTQPHHIKIDLSPRQFRTKGELKGYTPLPLNAETNKASPDIQQSATSGFDLLDWGSACNDFVQQLQTGNRKRLKKKRPFSATKNLIKNDEKMMARQPGTTANDLSEIPKEILQSINDNNEKYSSSDEDKPLVEIKNSITHDNMPEILTRNFREKQRQVIEQKYAARLGRPSSSESETDTRKALVIVKRVRRLRKREHLGIKKTDDEHSVEEGEIDDDAHNKNKNSKVPSKLDDLTSSDEDKKKSVNDDKKTSESKTVDGCSKRTRKSMSELKETQKKTAESSEDSSESTSEVETTEDKIKKLATERNAKKLKDLGDGSNFKVLLQEEETMTRSKRKLEIEKKLSNSKILRNDKIVQNITPDKKGKVDTCTSTNKKSPLKRKDSNKSEDSKRKMPESETEKESTNSTKKKQRKISRAGDKSSTEASEEEEEEANKTERLRPRKNKTESEITAKPATKETVKKKVAKEEIESTLKASDYKEGRRSLSALYPFREDKTSKFTPGWEMEAYNFKRSLNVPPGLITIGRPPQHGISHSLPDLDPQTSDTSEIFSEFIKSKDRDVGKDVRGEQSRTRNKLPPPPKPEIKKPPNSIIDLLHQRVIQSSNKKIKQTKKATTANNKDKDKNKYQDKDKVKEKEVAKPSKEANESQPTSASEKEGDNSFGYKKNIFEPFIITSRTRTENNAIRKKEILKEVFGTDEDRPRSAPPSAHEQNNTEVEGEKRLSFDQKYREYLEKMNVDFPERKTYLPDVTKIKQEIKEEEDDFDDNETVVASERDLVTPTLKSKTKKNRPRRLKGSSGFDYIRKKKKPTPNNSENPLNVNAIIKKRLAAMENQETKDENDISKEIKGWVLNKGVGESVLHKASRLNYVDVVAYCLDRISMSPDSKDNAGYTPLHEACSRGHLEIARLLLQYGANHSEAALSGIRPLHEAIENGHIEMVRLLLSFGADPCLATYSGQLPITMADDKEMEDFLSAYLIDTDHKEGRKTSWAMDGAFKIEDPDEIGYDIFSNVPIVKTDLGSSVASILSTSMTSLVTATTQLSDNETVISETATTIPSKILSTTPQMKAPIQDLIKYQHKMKKCDTNSNNLVVSDANNTESSKGIIAASKKTKSCSVILNNIDSTMKKIKKLPSISKLDSHTIKSNEAIHKIEEISNHKEDYDDMIIDENLESDCEFFELEESEAPLPPLYLLRGEGSDKWMLLADLCILLKVKSKEAVLKQICPSSPPSANKELIRELKMSEFLEKAICLQLFCAGEKINIRASKVSLVRYTENVKNLLGVHTIKMNL